MQYVDKSYMLRRSCKMMSREERMVFITKYAQIADAKW